MHELLRTATIEHMRLNADFYRQYMAVNNVRRNPKRKTTAALPTRIDTSYYTEEQLQLQFEDHVEKMGQPGEWADNMEVSAFASALNVHVRLWQADYTYLFSPRVYYVPDQDSQSLDSLQTLHIAYHVSPFWPLFSLTMSLMHCQSWEHYSSVRNVAGPHTGLPNVHVSPEIISKKRSSPSIDGEDDDQLSRARKRRSPLPLFDSDSTPEGTESSSDESNGPMSSQPPHLNMLPEDSMAKPQKLTIKLRGLRTTDATDHSESSRASSPALAATTETMSDTLSLAVPLSSISSCAPEPLT